MAEEKKKEDSEASERTFFGLNLRETIMGNNTERIRPKLLENSSTVSHDKELHIRFKKTILGG